MRIAANNDSSGYKLYKDTHIIRLHFNTNHSQYALIINEKYHFPIKPSIEKEEVLRLEQMLNRDN